MGLTLTRTGFSKHVTNKINLAKQQFLKLKRFYELSPKLQVRLYTTMVRPIMECPPIPSALASKSQNLQMQRVQSKALKNAARDTDNRHLTIEQLHYTYGLEAINVRLYNRMMITRHKIHDLNKELYNETEEANNNNIRDHYWWPRVGKSYVADPPEPMYTAP